MPIAASSTASAAKRPRRPVWSRGCATARDRRASNVDTLATAWSGSVRRTCSRSAATSESGSPSVRTVTNMLRNPSDPCANGAYTSGPGARSSPA